MTTLQQRLQAALPAAMKARDQPAVTALERLGRSDHAPQKRAEARVLVTHVE
jgi:hypothetical protein